MRAIRAFLRRDPFTVLLLTLIGVKLLVLVATVDRGLEMGDEGYFLLNLNRPESALPPLEIYRFLSVLGGGREIGVIEARLVRIAAELAGALALAVGVHAWARRRYPGGSRTGLLAFLAFAGQGTFVSVASRSLGYNDMTNLFSFSAVGCIFGLAAAVEGPAWRRTAYAVAAGALSALQITAKFPPGLLLVAGTGMVVSSGLVTLPWRERMRLLASYGGALAGVLGLVVATTGGLGEVAERLAVARRLPGLTGYDPVSLLARYVILDVFTEFNVVVFCLVFAVSLRLTGRRFGARSPAAIAAAFAIASVVLLASVQAWQPDFMHWSLVYFASLVVGLAAVLGFLAWQEGRVVPGGAGRLEIAALLGLLAGLPFIAIVGTNVPVSMRFPTHVLPLFALLALLVPGGDPRRSAGWLREVVAGALVFASALVFVQHHWVRPYGLRTAISEQTAPAPGRDGVKVDLATRSFLELFSRSLEEAGFRRGDPLLAFDYTPGLVRFVGGTSPRYNLYMFDMTAYNCFNLEQAEFRSPPFVVLLQPMSPELARCARAIHFPEGFRLVRTLRFPFEAVYAGFGKPGLSHLEIYAPIEERPGQGR